jgi:putative oxidoreductase
MEQPMSIYDPARAPWPSRVLSVLRIVAGLTFLMFGTMKLFGFPPPPPGSPPMPPFDLTSQTTIGALLEAVGGLLILLGLFTRPVAFILSGEMAVAYWQFHAPGSPYPATNMGTPAVLYCFIFLYFVFSGPGEWSIDALLARSRSRHGAFDDGVADRGRRVAME